MTDQTSQAAIQSLLEGDGDLKTWVRDHLDYQSDRWCLIWPFASRQGATVQVGKPPLNVCRLMCEYRNGPPPTPKHQAAHSCGRRHEGCVNPQHLSWKTNAENQVERYQHSGLTKRTKLTPEQVDEIRALEGRAPVLEIAQQFGISSNNVRRIFAGQLWKNPHSRHRIFTDAEVIAIRSTPMQEKPTIEWARELGVHRAAIDRIRAGSTYKWVQQ
jgi:AraC-like DNA-binding protein